MARRHHRLALAGLAVLAVSAAARGAAPPEWNRVDAKRLPPIETVQQWHAAKDLLGPALSGAPSWTIFLTIIETKLREMGAVDITRHAWTYDRWHTTEWPDTSAWSLVSDGKPVRVASYGANSGTTPPAGVTADLVWFDPASPPPSVAGKIAVIATVPEDERTPAAERVYEVPGDYLFLSNPETFPNPRIPRALSNKGSLRAEMRQATRLIDTLVKGKAAGAIFTFEASYERLAGLYTFGVPPIHQLPTLYVDREAARPLVADARRGRPATLRLVGQVTPTETWQLMAWLPGRDYGTPADQQIMFTTHTDGPSISQDNGGFGLLAVAHYFSSIPRQERPRTLMFFFDNRHYMPGAERAFAKQNWLDAHPEAWKPIVATIGMEHLGQLEFEEQGGRWRPTGKMEHSRLHASDNDRLVEVAIKAVKDNALRRVTVEQVDRPGIHGTSQGAWLGLGAVGRRRGLPAFAIMGDMTAYWHTSARLAHFDAKHFLDQVATMAQLTGELMIGDLNALKPRPATQ